MIETGGQDEVEVYIQDLLRDGVEPEPGEPPPAAAGETDNSRVLPISAPPVRRPPADPADEQDRLSPVQRAALERLLQAKLEVAAETGPASSVADGSPASLDRQALASAASRPRDAVEPAAAQEPGEVAGEALAWHANGRPFWAQGPFEALLFEVSGLTLAVPLVVLGQIHPLNSELSKVFGQAEWFMGLQPAGKSRIRCVNTALFVMPERYDEKFVRTAKYVVSIDGMDWGLAVDKVRQPLTIHPDEVTWRAQRAKRPWLAGTVKSAMCALLDLPCMGEMLEASDRKRR